MPYDQADDDMVAQLAELNRAFMGHVPHNVALGLRFTDLQRNVAAMALPYHEKLIGNPQTGVLHGGVVTALLDACCGAAVFMALPKPMAIATLDLRIDYLRPAPRGFDVHARTECYRRTRNVAFVRGAAAYRDGDRDVEVASCAGSFMLGTRSKARTQDDSDND